MISLFNSVLETASLFKNCDGYSQSVILREECAKTSSILQEGDPTNGNA